MNVVIRLDTALNAFPHAFPIGIAAFNRRPDLVDKFRVGHRDLEIGALGVALEAVDILSVCDCHGMDRRLVLRDLCFEICFIGVAILWLEVDRCCDIEVVLEVRHMQHDRVAVFRDTKKLHGSTTSMESTFLQLDVLEDEVVGLRIECRNWRPIPSLVLLGVALLQI